MIDVYTYITGKCDIICIVIAVTYTLIQCKLLKLEVICLSWCLTYVSMNYGEIRIELYLCGIACMIM